MRRRRFKQPVLPVTPQEIDSDGWPVAGDDSSGAINQRHLWEQQRLRAYEQAVLEDRYFPAAMDALKLCLDRRLPLPEWLGKELWAILVKFYAKPRNSKRYEAETRRREKHMRRWDLVRGLLDHRDELDVTRNSAPAKAVPLLRQYGDKGKEEAVWKSFTKVERAFKEGRPGSVYCAEFRLRPLKRVKRPAQKS